MVERIRNYKEEYSRRKEYFNKRRETLRIYNRRFAREYAWRSVGIDVDKANSLLSENDKCQICGEKKALVIDHCHSSNKIRGTLCRTCNLGMGLFKDSKELLLKAYNYL